MRVNGDLPRTSLLELSSLRNSWGYNLQQTADAIEYEISCANKRIYGYEGLDERQVFTKLAQEVGKMRNEQQKRQQQLEQASETKHTTE